MEDVKQILVVDDYFQMLEFLRSVLEFSHHEYQVLAVPSAEEGLLELRRTKFDLVITDVRLPGMSGFDLVRKVKVLNSSIPIIMITGYSSEQGKKEADELGVKRYFKKPLDPDELLATVHSVLYGAEEVEPISAPAETTEAVDISTETRRRLESLRSDTGARHVVLSTAKGNILHDGGVGQEMDLPNLVSSITESMQASFHLAQKLETKEPFTIQYQAGERYDLYLANVGRDYFLTLFFDAQARRGRLGTIWVFAQRAINDLQGLLKTGATAVSQKAAAAPAKSTPTARPALAKQQPAVEPPRRTRKVEPAPVSEPIKREITEVPELEPAKELDPQALAEIQEMLGIQASGETETVDLDSFWDIDFEGSDGDSATLSGMSLDEARKQGLIPTDFDDAGRPKS